MQAGSVRAMAAVLDKTNAAIEAGADAGRLGDELFSFALTLDAQHSLRRALTEPAVPPEAKSRLLDSLAGGKVDGPTLEVLDVAVRHRWSQGRDLGDALEQASVTAHVAKADAAGRLDVLEDSLFRFSRITEADPGLREALSEQEAPLEGKRALVRRLVEGKVDDSTLHLLGQAVAGRHRSVTAVLARYQKIAAERRRSLVATVWVGSPLSDNHKARLERALAGQYSREVHLNVIVEPSVLGGVRVAVGDEVIDGTVETRLKQAHRMLDQ
jgi:F-type H+-transporting ATPase subunit delta